ncbi:MAG TPA: ATP-binding cassette domain-containing protein [Polyangiaceae bacterium]|nr:ATP-binding cassette domain-containing protein [Polyangiaceae bacterium]
MQANLNLPTADRRPLQACLAEWTYGDRSLVFRLGLVSALSAVLSLGSPRLTQLVFDRALPDGSPRLMLVAAAAAFALTLHSAWLDWVQAKLSIQLWINLERRSLTRVVRALVHAQPEQRKLNNAGWTMTTLNGAGTAAQRFSTSVVTLLGQGMACAGYLISLSQFSPGAALIVLGVNCAVFYLGLKVVRFEAGHVQRSLECSSMQQQYLHLLLSRIDSLRGLFATERLAQRWSMQVDHTAEAQLESGKVGLLMGTVDVVGTTALSTGISVWASYQCFGGSLTLGEMMFLLTAAGGLSATLGGTMQAGLGLKALGPYAGRVDALVQLSRPRPQTSEVATGERIIVDHAWFRYSRDDRWILQNHDFEVRRGEMVHLRAPSGSGKSTLLRLIAGLLEPTQGNISVFGMTPAEASEMVLYLPQSCELFETSIRHNLELLSCAPRERILQVAQQTGLSRMLQSLPMGEETRVAAQGQNLSSGQRQLILLTAAFASNREVLLLDEATGQIDAQTRGRFDRAALTQGRTVIWVEHDQSQ